MTVLVLDIGSSSARALLFDDHAQPIPGALVQRKYQMETNPPGAATLDAEVLRSVVEACIDDVLQHPAAQTITVVGVATFAGNVVGLDETGAAITPIYLYADTRCAEDVEALRAALDSDAIRQRTGCRLHSAYHPARLRWLGRSAPELSSRIHLWADFAAYLFSHWSGQAATSYSIASWSGLLNRAALDWDHDWLALLGSEMPVAPLPALHDYDQFTGTLNAVYSQRWAALKNVPLCLAIGDGAAANIGSGCVDSTSIALSVGTTAALRISVPAGANLLPIVPPGLWSYRTTRDLHLLGGATSEGGNLYKWARTTLQLPETFLDQVTAQPVDSHGLTILPLLAGERSPGWAADATGSIVGLRLSTTPLDIAQAFFESLALRLSLVYEQVNTYAAPDARIIANGGGLPPYLAQLIADACGHPVHVTADTEITSRGVALLALRSIGNPIPLGVSPEIAYVKTPRPAESETLHGARERQISLYRKLVGDFHSPI